MQKCTAGAAAHHPGLFFIQLSAVISPVPYGPHMEHLEHLQSEAIKASSKGDVEGFWDQCHLEPDNQTRVLTVRLEIRMFAKKITTSFRSFLCSNPNSVDSFCVLHVCRDV